MISWNRSCKRLEQPWFHNSESNKDKGKGPVVVDTLNVIATGMYKFNSNCRIKFQQNFNLAK